MTGYLDPLADDGPTRLQELVALLRRDHGNLTGGERQEVADMLEAKPKVKPLVWKWYRDPKETSEARTSIGSWTVWEINGSAYCYGPDDTCGRPCGGDINAAKAAAQADYERRILSALEGYDD